MILTGSTWQKLRHVHEDGRIEVVYFLVIGHKIFARINGMKGNKSRMWLWQPAIEAWLGDDMPHPSFTASSYARAYVDSYLRSRKDV